MKQQSAPDLSLFSSRLRHLHNIISLVSDDVFDLETFNYTSKLGCKTTGCAAGWAAQDSVFQSMGFVPSSNIDWAPSYLYFNSGFESIEAFFGLSRYESEYLFRLRAYRHELFSAISACGKYKQEFLDRIERQIWEMEVKEHETAIAS